MPLRRIVYIVSMLQVDLPLSYAVGAGLALAAHKRLRYEDSLWFNRHLMAAVSYFGIAHVPASLFFLTLWPDWDVMYAWSGESLPIWVSPLFALGLFVSGLLGFVATHGLIRKDRIPVALGLVALCLLFTGAVCAIWHDRFLFVGTQAQYQAGPAINIHKSDLPWGFAILIGGVMGLPQAALMLRFWREK